jgi:hypothetical protein
VHTLLGHDPVASSQYWPSAQRVGVSIVPLAEQV